MSTTLKMSQCRLEIGAIFASVQKDKKSRSGIHKVNVSRLLILVIIIFAILWLPVHLHLLMAFYARSWIHETDAYQVVSVLCTSLAYFNSCVNPIIYNRTSKEFRDAFREAIRCGQDGPASGGAVEVAAGGSRRGAAATSAKTKTMTTAVGEGERAAVSNDSCIRRTADQVEAAHDGNEQTDLLQQPNNAGGPAGATCGREGIEPANDGDGEDTVEVV